jgi:hypothetical protein
MALPLDPQPTLEIPSLCWIIEHGDGDLPLALPAELGRGPRIMSTRELENLPFTTGARAERRQLDTLVRNAGRTAYFRLAEFTGGATVTGEVDAGGPMSMSWQGGGTFTSAASLLVGDPAGALAFDGSHYLKMAADDDRLDLRTGSVSFAIWFRTTEPTQRCLYAKADNGSITNGIHFDVGAALAGRSRVIVHGIQCLDPGLGLHDGQPHLVGCTLDRTGQFLALYVDGIERYDGSATSGASRGSDVP